jgi:hypothetical protein
VNGIGLKPEGGGRVDEEGKETKYLDPVTGKQRVRIDRGHVDKKTGEQVDDPPSAGVPHVHGYDESGKKKIRDETGDPHFPLKDPPSPSPEAPSGSEGPGSGGTTGSGGTGGNGGSGCIPPNQVPPRTPVDEAIDEAIRILQSDGGN